MAPAEFKRLSGRKVIAIACFDSFGKLAMTMLAACRREGAETTLLLLELNNRPSPGDSAWKFGESTPRPASRSTTGTIYASSVAPWRGRSTP